MKKSFAWITVNEAIDDEGFYLEDGPKVREIEREELKKLGAADTEHIEFQSILAEDRDTAMAEALVTPAFIEWAKRHQETGEQCDEDHNGESNLVFYEEHPGWK